MLRNALAGPATQSDESLDWTTRMLRRMPNNPYGPQFGGSDFQDNIFVVPQAPANTLNFDRNAFSPEWLDLQGRLHQPPGPRPLRMR